MGIMTCGYHRVFEACCGGAGGAISTRETRDRRLERSAVSEAATRERGCARRVEAPVRVAVVKSVKGVKIEPAGDGADGFTRYRITL